MINHDDKIFKYSKIIFYFILLGVFLLIFLTFFFRQEETPDIELVEIKNEIKAVPEESNFIDEIGLWEDDDPDLFLDKDQDFLLGYEEINIYKTDPNNPDTDGDGLRDGEEVMIYKTDPNKFDNLSEKLQKEK